MNLNGHRPDPVDAQLRLIEGAFDRIELQRCLAMTEDDLAAEIAVLEAEDRVDVEFHLIESVDDRLDFERSLAMSEEELLEEIGALAARDQVVELPVATSVVPTPAPAKVVALSAARERKRVPLWSLAAAAAACLAVGSGGTFVALSPALAPASPAPQPSIAPQVAPEVLAAIQLRDEAQMECARHQWGRCIDRLDDAAKLDPDGDRLPESALLREIAKEKLGASTPTDPDDFRGGEVKPRFGPVRAPKGRTP